MSNRALPIFCLSLCVSILACAHYPGDGGNDDDAGTCTENCPPDGGNPPACDGDEDCGCGESCTDGACVKTACCDNGDCPNGDVCEPATGECGPPDMCAADGDCTCGSQCDGGACTPGCDDSGDCCGEDVCDGGTCVPPPPDGCTTDDDCPDGKVCENGTCVCDGDDDDGDDLVCKDGKVLLCHYPPGHPANRHEICVGPSAVPAHVAHGDDLGACL